MAWQTCRFGSKLIKLTFSHHTHGANIPKVVNQSASQVEIAGDASSNLARRMVSLFFWGGGGIFGLWEDFGLFGDIFCWFLRVWEVERSELRM